MISEYYQRPGMEYLQEFPELQTQINGQKMMPKFLPNVMYGNALCILSLSGGIGSHILYLIRDTVVHNPHLWVL